MSKKTTFRTVIALASALTLSVSINSYANNPLSGFFSGFWGSSKDAKSESSSDKGSQASSKSGASSSSSGDTGSGSGGSSSGASGSGTGTGTGANNSGSGNASSSSSTSNNGGFSPTNNTPDSSDSDSDSSGDSDTSSGDDSSSGSSSPSSSGSGSSSGSSPSSDSSSDGNSPFGGGPGNHYTKGISSGSLSGLSGLTGSSSSSGGSLTIDELEAVSVSFVMYLNSTFYQLPYGYALAPQSIQSNLQLFNATNQEDNQNFDSTLNFSTMTLVQSGSQIPLRVTSSSGDGKTIDYGLTNSQGTSASNTLTLQENIDSSDTCDSGTSCLPRNVSAIAALFCNTTSNSTEGTACFNRMKNFSSIDASVNNDPLLYALTSMPTSGVIAGMKNTSEEGLTSITLTNAQASTSSYALPGTTSNPVNNNILSFSNLFNASTNSISTANYFVEFVTAAYTSNMALNPCFNNPGAGMSAAIQASATSGADSVNGLSSSSSSSSSSTAPTSPCDSGYNLSTDISALLLTDKSNSCTNSDPGTNCLLFKMEKSTPYKQFQFDLRTSIARKSILTENLHHLFQERVKQTYTNTTSTTGSLLIDAQPTCSTSNSCSALDLQRFVANHRLQNLTGTSSRLTWFDRLKTASPSLLARERTLMMAEMLQLQERTYELTERILATNTVNASQNGRTFYNLMLQDVSTLSRYAEKLQKSATSSSDSSSSDSSGASSSDTSSSNSSDSSSSSSEASKLESEYGSGSSGSSGSSSSSSSDSSNSSSSSGNISSNISSILNG